MKNLYLILILLFTVNINAANNDYLRVVDNLDSTRVALTGFEWTGVHERTISSTHSDASKRALVRAWQTGKFTDYLKFYAAELGGQWTDPELVSMGVLSGFIGYATTVNVVARGGVKLAIRSDIVLSGGRSGQLVKNLKGPANSVLKGGQGRFLLQMMLVR